jgi:putative hydrolase of the HAD superfamily
MIKTIIFDFGGVLCDLNFEKCIQSFAKAGYPVELLNDKVISSGIFQKFNIGTISEEDFFEGLRQQGNLPDSTDEQLRSIWNEIIVNVPPQRFEALKKLEQHYPLYLLSNTNYTHWKYCLENVWNYQGESFTSHFRKIFLSFEMHKEKPNKDIFQEVISSLNILPEETLFIDDNKKNVDTARSLGLHTLQALGDEWIEAIVDKPLLF